MYSNIYEQFEPHKVNDVPVTVMCFAMLAEHIELHSWASMNKVAG